MRLDAADGALNDVATMLRRVHELTMQASNDTIGATERATISIEVQSVKDAMVSLANTEVGGSYIFAGFLDDAPPFDATGAFSGSSDILELDVSEGVRMAVAVAGDATFSGAGGGVDVFTSLDTLVTALQTNDMANIQLSIDTIMSAHGQIGDARVALGASQQAVDVAESVVQRETDRAALRQGELIGADPIDALLELQQAQSVYETAVQIASQMPGPGLVGR